MDLPESSPLAQERLAHANALQLLQHTRDYLARLPRVPATQEVVRQIDAFLANPQAATARARAQEERALARTWSGGAFTAVGEPLVAAQLEGKAAQDGSPASWLLTLTGKALESVGPDTVVMTGLTGSQTHMPGVLLELRPARQVHMQVLPRGEPKA